MEGDQRICHVNFAHKTITIVDDPHSSKSQYFTNRVEWGGSNSAVTVYELTKGASDNQKQGVLYTDARAFIIRNSRGQMQGSNNKKHNHLGNGIEAHKSITSKTTQIKTSQPMEETLTKNKINELQVQQHFTQVQLEWKWCSPSTDEHAEQHRQTVEDSAHFSTALKNTPQKN